MAADPCLPSWPVPSADIDSLERVPAETHAIPESLGGCPWPYRQRRRTASSRYRSSWGPSVTPLSGSSTLSVMRDPDSLPV